MLPKLTLVLGGAASGKSQYAETLVLNDGRRPVYLATAEAWDDEMRAKIDKHIARRGAEWRSIDCAQDTEAQLGQCDAGEVVLLDCATMWLSARMMAEQDLTEATQSLLTALDTCAAAVVVVSNELGLSVVPENAMARQFREAQGRLNQEIAARADLVAAVMAGLPLALKGRLP